MNKALDDLKQDMNYKEEDSDSFETSSTSD